MKSQITSFFGSRLGIIVTGCIIGILAPLLQYLGNPPNMGICVACFERDIAGALGLHRAGVVQYLRPEIIALVLGSLMAAFSFKEFRPRTGSAPIVRFVLGAFAMIGALAFLGCPWRALLRLAGGDMNAITGLLGLVAGIAVGVQFLKNGYNLGRSRDTFKSVGLMMPVLMVGLLLLLLFKPQFNANSAVFFSIKGPGAMAAPVIISIVAGLAIGFLAQRSRFCTMGSFRDIILMKDFHLASGIASFAVTAFIINLILGQFRLGISAMPIAHSSHLWSFLGMVLAGLAFTLAGGCPGRQLILSGEGDADSSVFVIGMIVSAGFAHNFALAGKPDKIIDGVVQVGGISSWGMVAVVLGIVSCIVIGLTMREKV